MLDVLASNLLACEHEDTGNVHFFVRASASFILSRNEEDRYGREGYGDYGNDPYDPAPRCQLDDDSPDDETQTKTKGSGSSEAV